jgi:hypothetical protein
MAADNHAPRLVAELPLVIADGAGEVGVKSPVASMLGSMEGGEKRQLEMVLEGTRRGLDQPVVGVNQDGASLT